MLARRIAGTLILLFPASARLLKGHAGALSWRATMWDHQSQTPLFTFCAVDTLPSGVQLI
jgi:hypothetical protein